MNQIDVSVIIPTYNRVDSLRRLLCCLASQTYPYDRFELIVVDDGSTDNTQSIVNECYPYSLKYLRQDNQGATVARNQGALNSRGDILVFIDDDVTISSQTLEALVEECAQDTRAIVMGTLVPRTGAQDSIFSRIMLGSSCQERLSHSNEDVPFTECNTQLLSVKRNDFFLLGMFQDPTGGWPNWDDVDFGYRAYFKRFRIRQSSRATGEHWDYALADLATSCHRWQRASKSAVRLFQEYLNLELCIPMFHDKTPIVWRQDPPRLIARKLARYVASSRPALWGMERIVSILEQHYPSPTLLRPLYRWIIGGYIFRGYRQGLREYGAVGGSR